MSVLFNVGILCCALIKGDSCFLFGAVIYDIIGGCKMTSRCYLFAFMIEDIKLNFVFYFIDVVDGILGGNGMRLNMVSYLHFIVGVTWGDKGMHSLSYERLLITK